MWQVLAPQLMAWFSLLLVLFFVCFYSSCLFFVCYYYLLCIFLLYTIYLLLLFISSIWDEVKTKDRFFYRGCGMRVEALKRVLGFWGELGIIISAGQNNWVVFWFGWGVGRCEVATSWCGKINSAVIGIKLRWSDFWLMFSIEL